MSSKTCDGICEGKLEADWSRSIFLAVLFVRFRFISCLQRSLSGLRLESIAEKLFVFKCVSVNSNEKKCPCALGSSLSAFFSFWKRMHVLQLVFVYVCVCDAVTDYRLVAFVYNFPFLLLFSLSPVKSEVWPSKGSERTWFSSWRQWLSR